MDLKLAFLKQEQKQINGLTCKTRAYERVSSRFYMYYIISKKTRTTAGRPHLVRSPCFIPDSVYQVGNAKPAFYT